LGVLKDRADKLFTPLLPEKKRRAIEVSKKSNNNFLKLRFNLPFNFRL
jgi:hypothetical protein